MNASRLEDHGIVVILDGLDKCSSKEDLQNILEMLSSIAVKLSFPLSLLVVSWPEQAIRGAFAKELLKSLTSFLALEDSDSDVQTFLQAQFDDIKQNHSWFKLPPAWPSKQEIKCQWLVEKSSGKVIYALIIAKFISSKYHNPQERLDIVLGKAPKSSNHPFVQLDAMYYHTFSSIIHIEEVLDIFALLLLCKSMSSQPSIVDEFLSYTPRSTRTILSGLHSFLLVPRAAHHSCTYGSWV